MNKIKKLLGKKNWETIWTKSCKCNCTSFCTGEDSKITATVVVKIDRERKKVKCYITDGFFKNKTDLSAVICQNNELAEILDNEGIKY